MRVSLNRRKGNKPVALGFLLSLSGDQLHCLALAPISPNIIIQIFLTGVHTFCCLVIRRTSLNIRTIYLS